MWRKFYDGWFEYYYNIETGEKKFKLDPGDILVDYRNNSQTAVIIKSKEIMHNE